MTAATGAPSPEDAVCSECGHLAADHRQRIGCIEVTWTGGIWEGCACPREAIAARPGAVDGER
jgi:hypothetical protein